MPQRIQRKRTKGWRMPPNTIYVGRGSKWGNPFTFANSGRVHPALRFACEIAPLLDVSPLRGKNLACWCSLKSECHADVLLHLANEPRVSKAAMDWAIEASAEVEAYKAANPDWREHGKSFEQFRREVKAKMEPR